MLIEEDTTAGLDEAEIVYALQNDAYLERVEAATRALEVSSAGVPTWPPALVPEDSRTGCSSVLSSGSVTLHATSN